MGIRKDLSLSFDFRQAGVGRDEVPLAVKEMEQSAHLRSHLGVDSRVGMSGTELFLAWELALCEC